MEEEERSECIGLSNLVAGTEQAEAEDPHTDYQYDVPEDFEMASLGYQLGANKHQSLAIKLRLQV